MSLSILAQARKNCSNWVVVDCAPPTIPLRNWCKVVLGALIVAQLVGYLPKDQKQALRYPASLLVVSSCSCCGVTPPQHFSYLKLLFRIPFSTNGLRKEEETIRSLILCQLREACICFQDKQERQQEHQLFDG